MKRELLIIVARQPPDLRRAAEAIRMASGMASWQKVGVSVFLGPALTRRIKHDPSLLETLQLPKDGQVRLTIPAGTGMGPLFREEGVPVQETNEDQLAAQAVQSSSVLYF